MVITSITTLLFIFTYVALSHRYIITTNLKHPDKKELILIVLSTMTYFLVIKLILDYILLVLE